MSHKDPDDSSLNISPIKFSMSCQQDPPDYQMRIDRALTKYLEKNLGKKYENNYEISIIDYKDVISSKTIPEYEQARILKQMLPGTQMLILLEGDRKTAKFTIIKDTL